jgi:hypothetical protein
VIDAARGFSPNSFAPSVYEIIQFLCQSLKLDFLKDRTVAQISSGDYQRPPPGPVVIELKAPEPSRISTLLVEEQGGPDAIPQEQLLVELLTIPYLTVDFEGPSLRPVPELSPLFQSELPDGFLLTTSTQPLLLFDSTENRPSRRELPTLLLEATKRQLTQAEIDHLLPWIRGYPADLATVALPQSSLSQFAEQNPTVASEFFIARIPADSSVLTLIPHLGLSLGSVEVIRQLIQGGLLPPPAVEDYLSNTLLILTQLADKATKAQKYRLFCDFVKRVRPNNLKFTDNLKLALGHFALDCIRDGIARQEAQELRDSLGLASS